MYVEDGNNKYKECSQMAVQTVFELKLDVPNETTAAAIEEGRKMLSAPSAPRCSNMDTLKAALEV